MAMNPEIVAREIPGSTPLAWPRNEGGWHACDRIRGKSRNRAWRDLNVSVERDNQPVSSSKPLPVRVRKGQISHGARQDCFDWLRSNRRNAGSSHRPEGI